MKNHKDFKMIQLLLKIQDFKQDMSEFRENIIISSNILMYVMIVLHLIILLFDPIDVSDEAAESIKFFAVISFISLLLQFWFTKIVDIIYDFFKNYEIKKKL